MAKAKKVKVGKQVVIHPQIVKRNKLISNVGEVIALGKRVKQITIPIAEGILVIEEFTPIVKLEVERKGGKGILITFLKYTERLY